MHLPVAGDQPGACQCYEFYRHSQGQPALQMRRIYYLVLSDGCHMSAARIGKFIGMARTAGRRHWKMHGSRAANRALLEAHRQGDGKRRKARMRGVRSVPYLQQVSGQLAGTRAGLGAQTSASTRKARTPGKCRPRCWPSSLPQRDRGAFGSAAISTARAMRRSRRSSPRRRARAWCRSCAWARRWRTRRRNHGGSRASSWDAVLSKGVIQARFWLMSRWGDRHRPDGDAAASAAVHAFLRKRLAGEVRISMAGA